MPAWGERLDDATKQISRLIWQLRDDTRDNADQQALVGSLETTINGRATLVWQALWRARHNDRPGAEKVLENCVTSGSNPEYLVIVNKLVPLTYSLIRLMLSLSEAGI